MLEPYEGKLSRTVLRGKGVAIFLTYPLKSSVELLATYTTPEEMLAVDTQTDLLNKASRGRLGLDKANQIQQCAKNSFGIMLASSSFSLIIRQYLEQLKSLETSIAIFDAEIARLSVHKTKKFSHLVYPPKKLRLSSFLAKKFRQSGILSVERNFEA